MRSYFLSMIRQPSTWAGIGLVVTQAAQAVATRDPQAIGATLAGVLAILAPEGLRRTGP